MEMHLRRLTSLMSIMLALLCLTAPAVVAENSTSSTSSQPGQTIKIGFVGSLTSIGEDIGKNMLNGMNLYLDQVHHTMAGKKVEFIVENDESSPAKGAAKVRKLVNEDKVSVLTGFVLSHILYAAAPVVEELKTPLVVSVAASDDVTQRKRSRWIVRTSYSSSQAAHALGEYAFKKLGYKRVITVAADYAYGWEVVGGFQQCFEEAGGKVVQKVWTPLGFKDFTEFIKKIRSSDADAIFLCMVGPPAQIVPRQLRSAGIKLPLLGTAHTFDESFYPSMKDEVEGSIGANPYSVALETPANQKFVKAYRNKFGSDPAYLSEFGYTAMMAINKAVDEVKGKVNDKGKLMDALKKTALTDAPRGAVKLDAYGNVVDNIYVYRVERIKGKLQNTVIDKFPMVSQFWKYNPEKYLSQPSYSRIFPACKYCLAQEH